MFKKGSFATVILLGAVAGLPAFSQERGGSEASVQAFGSFVKTTTDNGIQRAPPTAAAFWQGYGTSSIRIMVWRSKLRVFAEHADVRAHVRCLRREGRSARSHSSVTSIAGRCRHLTPFVRGGRRRTGIQSVRRSGCSTQTRAAFVYAAVLTST